MGRPLFVFVSDDYNEVQRAKAWAGQNSYDVQVYSTREWNESLGKPEFATRLQTQDFALHKGSMNQAVPNLASTSKEGAVVLQFPPGGRAGGARVNTMNEVEKLAIENAILEYKGNLTEAAKALGIGRATLYRKVKQYDISPNLIRRKFGPKVA